MTDTPLYIVVFKDRRELQMPILQGDIRAVLTAGKLQEIEFFQRLEGKASDYHETTAARL